VKRTAKTAASPGSNKLLLRRKITAFSRFGALSAADPGNGLPAHVTNIHFCDAVHARHQGRPAGESAILARHVRARCKRLIFAGRQVRAGAIRPAVMRIDLYKLQY